MLRVSGVFLRTYWDALEVELDLDQLCRFSVQNRHHITGLSNICVLSVAPPTITEGSSATSYEIAGTSITLTCTSTSGSGTYAWKLDGTAMYVILIIFRFIKRNATKVQPKYLQKWRNQYELYCTNNR